MRKETYLKAHELLMQKMRKQLKLRKPKEIQKTGRRLYRLRVRYRARFAS